VIGSRSCSRSACSEEATGVVRRDRRRHVLRDLDAVLSHVGGSSPLRPGVAAMRDRYATRYAHCYEWHRHLLEQETVAQPPAVVAATPVTPEVGPGPVATAPPLSATLSLARRGRSTVMSELAADGLAYLAMKVPRLRDGRVLARWTVLSASRLVPITVLVLPSPPSTTGDRERRPAGTEELIGGSSGSGAPSARSRR
jgi:hypothetical protein